MMTLEEKLTRLREGSRKRFPAEALEIMHRATQDLINSGAAQRALGEGDRMPSFSLPNQRRENVSLEALLERGPMVLTAFRGHW